MIQNLIQCEKTLQSIASIRTKVAFDAAAQTFYSYENAALRRLWGESLEATVNKIMDLTRQFDWLLTRLSDQVLSQVKEAKRRGVDVGAVVKEHKPYRAQLKAVRRAYYRSLDGLKRLEMEVYPERAQEITKVWEPYRRWGADLENLIRAFVFEKRVWQWGEQGFSDQETAKIVGKKLYASKEFEQCGSRWVSSKGGVEKKVLTPAGAEVLRRSEIASTGYKIEWLRSEGKLLLLFDPSLLETINTLFLEAANNALEESWEMFNG